MKQSNLKNLEKYQAPIMSEITLNTEQTILIASPSGMNFDFGGGFGDGGDI